MNVNITYVAGLSPSLSLYLSFSLSSSPTIATSTVLFNLSHTHTLTFSSFTFPLSFISLHPLPFTLLSSILPSLPVLPQAHWIPPGPTGSHCLPFGGKATGGHKGVGTRSVVKVGKGQSRQRQPKRARKGMELEWCAPQILALNPLFYQVLSIK